MKVVDLTLTFNEGMPTFPVEGIQSQNLTVLMDIDPTGSHRHEQSTLFAMGGRIRFTNAYNYFNKKKN